MGIDDSTARGRELGGELRRLRAKAGFTGHSIARVLGWAPAKVSRLETGARDVSDMDLAIFLATCRVRPDDLKRLLDMHEEEANGYWLRPHGERLPAELRSLAVQETTAASIHNYEPLIVPGLAQAENYARALFHEVGLLPRDTIESRVRARMDRQGLLHRPRSPHFDFFIHEQALRLPVGGPQVMHEQMLHLVFLSSRSRCTIRVIPISAGGKCCAGGGFMLMEYIEYKPVVYVEAQTTSLFLERPEDIFVYREVLDHLARIALNAGDSRELFVSLASEYDLPEEGLDEFR
jgi:transcriptional regulator with XRE-family HTH domain